MNYLNDINEKQLSLELGLLYTPVENTIKGKSSGVDSGLDVQRSLTMMELRDNPKDIVANKYLSQLDNLEALCSVPGGYVLQKQLNTPEDIQESIIKYNL